MEIFTDSAQKTQGFGEEFARTLKGGEVLGLVGGLGAGKTTFVQGLAQGLKINTKIISPTFILMRSYANPEGKNLFHIDLYRLEGEIEKELTHLGVEEFWEKRDNIVVIEWADKAFDLLPKNTIWINFEGNADEKRKITVKK